MSSKTKAQSKKKNKNKKEKKRSNWWCLFTPVLVAVGTFVLMALAAEGDVPSGAALGAAIFLWLTILVVMLILFSAGKWIKGIICILLLLAFTVSLPVLPGLF